MSADPSPGPQRLAQPSFARSVRHAWSGVVHAAATQRNLRVQAFVAAAVLIALALLHVQRAYVVATIVTIALVLSLELMNTAIEAVVDLLTLERHPLAKIAKDAAAGAVLVAAIGALAVGALVFSQALWSGAGRQHPRAAPGQVETRLP